MVARPRSAPLEATQGARGRHAAAAPDERPGGGRTLGVYARVVANADGSADASHTGCMFDADAHMMLLRLLDFKVSALLEKMYSSTPSDPLARRRLSYK
eukprot:361887-Chlamydomonas_euryale.AAC.1